MKFTVTKDTAGQVALQLGLQHYAVFPPDATDEDIVAGVLALVQKVTGIDPFEMAQEVVKAREEEAKTDG